MSRWSWAALAFAVIVEFCLLVEGPAKRVLPRYVQLTAEPRTRERGSDGWRLDTSHRARTPELESTAPSMGPVVSAVRAATGSAGGPAHRRAHIPPPAGIDETPFDQAQRLIDEAKLGGFWGPDEAREFAKLKAKLSQEDFDKLLARVVTMLNRFQMRFDGVTSVVPQS